MQEFSKGDGEMAGSALIQLALDRLSCSQKALAQRLHVSTAQVSKWKSGEYMSSGMEEKLRLLAGIGSKEPEFVLRAGSPEKADQWATLISFLAETADDGSETGYDTDPLREDSERLCLQTFDTLTAMGVAIPPELPVDLLEALESDSEDIYDLIESHRHMALIRSVFESFTGVYGFYVAYVHELAFDDELGGIEDVGGAIDQGLMKLAASKITENVQDIAPRFNEFKFEIQRQYTEWLNALKDRAFRAGIPLRAELLNMVRDSDAELGEEAERESLGFNASRLHPDIYMDELLQGMRVIHQVLPAIMAKLGIEDFTLDVTKLHV